MSDIQTGINSARVHEVYSEFIRQARGEASIHAEYTVELLKHEVVHGPIFDEWSWRGSKRVIKAIETFRGLTLEQQYEKGIVSMLTRTAGLLISHEMRRLFGIKTLQQIEHFEGGEFQISRKHDIIAPFRQNGIITRLGFYTIGEMKKWPV